MKIEFLLNVNPDEKFEKRRIIKKVKYILKIY